MENNLEQFTQPVEPISEIVPTPPQKSSLSKLWQFIFRTTLLVGILGLIYYFFLQPMMVTGEDPIEPFKNSQQIFSERVSFLFRPPVVGDAVIFKVPKNSINNFGIIAQINNEQNVTTYTIVSIKNQVNPWVVTRDKITGHIYYPSVTSVPTLTEASPIPSPTVSPTKSPSPSVSADPNIKTYTSNKLGITFNYQEKYPGLTEIVKINEQGDKVYLYMSPSNLKPDQGKYVQIFDKDPKDTLSEAIAKSVMYGYLPEDCPSIVKPNQSLSGYKLELPKTFTLATINLPPSAVVDMETAGPYVDKCPKGYLSFGGLAYFLMDSNYPAKFAFFSIGQDVLNGGDNISWQDTFRFTDQ